METRSKAPFNQHPTRSNQLFSTEFTILKTLLESDHFTLFRGYRNSDGKSFLIKTSKAPFPSEEVIKSFEHEVQFNKFLNPDLALRVLCTLQTTDHHVYSLLDDFDGNSLDSYLKSPIDLLSTLRILINISKVLESIHQAGIVHKNITPKNILLKGDKVKIANFEYASFLAADASKGQFRKRVISEDSLPYMAPEIIGRTNQGTDERSDLYSIGILFYQMLTGKYPFNAHNILEWTHSHVARVPIEPAVMEKRIPRVLSDMVMKLLSKSGEDRYQTIRGLRLDLQNALSQLETTQEITPFQLALRDISDRFQIVNKLYGREREIRDLMHIYDQVKSSGSVQLALILGEPGVGKSSIGNELRRLIQQKQGYFINGKFEYNKNQIPYLPISSAFSALIQQILTKSEPEVRGYREKLERALGTNGQLITEVIPDLEQLIGKQQPYIEISPTETYDRFQRKFQRFVNVFAGNSHPLVFFVDDFQWADRSTLKLIQSILLNSESHHLLIIGTLRPEEIGPGDPFQSFVNQIKQTLDKVHELHLSTLSGDQLNQLISDTLHQSTESTESLSRLVLEKTGGNPFFISRFLQTLYEEKHLRFDEIKNKWVWNFETINRKAYTENLTDFLIQRLKKLSEPSQNVLKLAACLGTTFQGAILTQLISGDISARDALQDPSLLGLISQTDENSYEFCHDRIRQAAYYLIPEDQRPKLHLEIGRRLFSVFSSDSINNSISPTHLFDIANQMNLGSALILIKDEKIDLARINLKAGIKAKSSYAYELAHQYLLAGIQNLGPNLWNVNPELAYELNYARIECLYLLGQIEEAEVLIDEVSPYAPTRQKQALLGCIRINLAVLKTSYESALKIAVDYLRLYQIEIPFHPSQDHLVNEYNKVKTELAQREGQLQIEYLPEVDEDTRVVMSILATIQGPALFTNQRFAFLVGCHSVCLSLKYKDITFFANGYTYLGMLVIPFFNQYQEGYRLAKLGYDAVKKANIPSIKPHVYMGFEHIAGWITPTSINIPVLKEGYEAAIQSDNLIYASYLHGAVACSLLIQGAFLDEVYKEIIEWHQLVKKISFHLSDFICTSNRVLIENLQGLTYHFSTFNSSSFDEEQFESNLRENEQNLKLAAFQYYVKKLQARFLSSDDDQAIAASKEAKRLLHVAPLFPEVHEYVFYTALTLSSRYFSVDPEQREKDRQELLSHQAQFKQWAENSPENFNCKCLLISAEIERIFGNQLNCERIYEQAIRSARENNFLQVEAMAYELASRFYRVRGFELIADTYLLESRHRYRQWGAFGKVKQIDSLYPKLHLYQRHHSSVKNGEFSGDSIDVFSVIQSSQHISSEIDLFKLQEVLMKTLVEYSGAQKGLLLLVSSEQLLVQAKSFVDSAGFHFELFKDGLTPSARELPISVINYCHRSNKKVVLPNASTSALFWNDDYIKDLKPRSILCLPIIMQTKQVGILYLENNLVIDAFSPEKLVSLELLTAQAAISITNSKLVLKLKNAVELRDEFLSVAAHELRTPLTPLKLQLDVVKNFLENPSAILSQSNVDFKKLIDISSNQFERLSGLVDNLLDVLRISSNHLILNREYLNLSDFVKRVVSFYEPKFKRECYQINMILAPNIQCSFDKYRMEQVLVNLFSNIIKFGNRKPVNIFVSATESTAVIKVQDQGIGISKDDQVNVFNRYGRAVSLRHFGGLGLGLYIAREIINLHGGSIELESEFGKGSTFTIKLPIHSQ